MVLVSKGDFIWIEPLAGEGIPVGARVLDQDHGRLKVVDDLGQEQWLSVDRRVRIMHPSSVQGVEDMTKLGDYHESAILRNILVRYREKLIYTYTGSILIAVNPYMDIPIYTAEQIRMYKRKKIGELPPHIFAIADNAYSNMKKHRKNQSVVISGESGAGKTESTKLVLQFLATISGQHSWIEQQVLEANPILEAFGNAKTVRNDNSSRFGKYIDVHFNSVGSIEGARIEKYLLEKSRIVSQSQGERNYHIFYCLLAGLSAEEKKHLELTRPSDYFYLTQGKSFEADGRDDAADLAEIRSAMKVLLFKEPEIGAIFQLLSALLHIGNVKYRESLDSQKLNLPILGTVVDTIEGVEVSDAANHIFKIEQAEYDREQINWRHIKFVDNQETLEMIAARPMNVFSIIDEESIFPKGTDQSMLSKLHTNHSKGSLYLRPKSDLQRSFGVKHFAGPVFYHTKGFLEKNRDAFSADLHALVQSSKMHLLLRIFDNVDYVESGTISGSIRGKGVTVSGQFRKSLDQLMQQLNHTEPFFIRCIKPNEFKRALMMDRDLVLRQLQYSGMMETIKIRRNGYPIRHDFEPFVRRYRVLVNGIGPLHRIDVRSAAEQICKKVLGSNSEFQLGKTKVFLKEKHDLYLEQEYHRMLAFRATVIQKNVRGWLAKRSFRKKKEAATVIQKHWRRYDQQKRYNQIVAGFCRLQAVLRSRQLVQHYQTLRHNIIQFQVGQLFDFLPTDSRPETSTDNESTSSDIIPTTAQANGTIDACDLEKYQFGKFAATYFQSQITATHSKKPLKSPLLSHEDPGTQLAAMAVWITILRFMGDLPDVKHGSNNGEVADKTPVMSRLFETLGRKYSHKDVEEAAHADEFDAVGRTLKKSMGKKLISMTLKRKSKLSAMSSSSSDHSSESTSSSNALMENRPMTSLDKLHYIIGMGILREELRDEIYCQLCKQLTSNPSRLSAARGWILLSLCVGCFAPSERFIKYLYCFIRERGPTGAGYSAYMEERLKRTELNGCRHQPPSYIELQANKSKKPIVLAVTFMDGSVKTLCADSATTADELCTQLAQKVGLKEKFGFSLYIALFDKVSSLGSGSDHVMDAISQCEQYAKEQGRQERNAPWRLFFRKEIFTPWHDSKEDPVSTNLIYQQEDDLAALAAQQYFVEEGPLDVNRLESQLHNYLPDFELNGKEMARERWIQSIMYHYRKKFGVNPPSPHHVKEEVVSFAKFKWPLLFSRFYEATKFSGPPLPRNDVIVAVNWTGIYVVDDQEHVLLEFSFPEITRVLHQKGPRPGFDTCTIKTVTGDEYSFQSPNAEDVKILVSTFIDGLKQRSRYVVATKPQRGSDSTNLLDFECGDLLVLLNKTTGKDLLTEKLVKGECARTCLQGLIQTENVYVLPTLVKPNVNTLQLFSKGEQMALDILNNNQVVVIQTNGNPILQITAPSSGSRLSSQDNEDEQVYFPDQSDEAVEVESSTRARDFCHRIAHRLALKKRDGFSLFVKIKEKVLAVPESEFFFDFVRQLSDWIQNNHALKETPIIPVNYQVFFMRKLWMNVKPGDDRNADLIFHYHQECPKYLLGYHKIAKQEAIELAAIILRAITKDSKNAPLAQIPQLLSELVPKDMMKLSSSSEWKKLISSAYVKVEHLTSDQAKIDFLTLIAKKETFGSAFFPVSQYSDLSLPDKLLIAINQNGVHLYDAESKVLITQYPFNVICNWTSGNTYFNMTVGNGIRSSEGKKLLLDTTMGYKMDDLITSYISVLITGQTIRPSSTWKHESVI
ncbi:myosin head [Ancylostoma ceylanicum]|uniref:Myosin head n=1 Tax=Ancylostoma ceylanicum TaxID=53326 RepID=A0A0D6LZU1_9BILA|nr:myosin head [Ancylostoma ceylanicum]